MPNKSEIIKNILKNIKCFLYLKKIVGKTLKFIKIFIGYIIYFILDFLARLFLITVLMISDTRKFFSWKRILSGIKNISVEFLKNTLYKKYTFKDCVEIFKLRFNLVWYGRERKRTFGNKNSDKVFFVVRPYLYFQPNIAIGGTQHLLSNYYSALHFIAYAKLNGWIPVVDWENYRLPHSEDFCVNGTKNAWEYFWKQPSPFTLEEVYESQNVILSHQNLPDGDILPPMRPTFPIEKYENEVVKKCKKYSELIQLNDFTREHIDKIEKDLFPKEKKILGVALRGSGYTKNYSGYYLKQPTIEELIELILFYKKEWNMDYIFFTNEETETVQKVKDILGDVVIIMPRIRYKNYHKYSDNSYDPNDSDPNPLFVKGQRYLTSLDYLSEMVLLSRCNAFIGAHSGGVRAALIWNNGKYEHVKIIDKGASQ